MNSPQTNPFAPNYNRRRTNSPQLNPFAPNFNQKKANNYIKRRNAQKKNAAVSPMSSVGSFKTTSSGASYKSLSPVSKTVGTQKKNRSSKRRVSVVPGSDLRAEARRTRKVIVIIPRNPQGSRIVKV